VNFIFNEFADILPKIKRKKNFTASRKRLRESGLFVDNEARSVSIPDIDKLTNENRQDLKNLESIGFTIQKTTFTPTLFWKEMKQKPVPFKNIVISGSFQDKKDLKNLFDLIMEMNLPHGDQKIKLNRRVHKIKVSHTVEFKEPKIESINGKLCSVYRSSIWFTTHHNYRMTIIQFSTFENRQRNCLKIFFTQPVEGDFRNSALDFKFDRLFYEVELWRTKNKSLDQ